MEGESQVPQILSAPEFPCLLGLSDSAPLCPLLAPHSWVLHCPMPLTAVYPVCPCVALHRQDLIPASQQPSAVGTILIPIFLIRKPRPKTVAEAASIMPRWVSLQNAMLSLLDSVLLFTFQFSHFASFSLEQLRQAGIKNNPPQKNPKAAYHAED